MAVKSGQLFGRIWAVFSSSRRAAHWRWCEAWRHAARPPSRRPRSRVPACESQPRRSRRAAAEVSPDPRAQAASRHGSPDGRRARAPLSPRRSATPRSPGVQAASQRSCPALPRGVGLLFVRV